MRTSRGSGDRGIHPRCTGILCVIKGNLLSFLKERLKTQNGRVILLPTGTYLGLQAYGHLIGIFWSMEVYIYYHGNMVGMFSCFQTALLCRISHSNSIYMLALLDVCHFLQVSGNL